jgi:hypothetical protein
MFKRVYLVLVLISAAACWLPPGPSPALVTTMDGTWAGTMTSDNLAAAGSIRATISQANGLLSGTWASSNSNSTNGGMVSGSVNGSSVSVTLTPGLTSTCALTVTATVNGTQMTGTFDAVSCATVVKGSITLTKQ